MVKRNTSGHFSCVCYVCTWPNTKISSIPQTSFPSLRFLLVPPCCCRRWFQCRLVCYSMMLVMPTQLSCWLGWHWWYKAIPHGPSAHLGIFFEGTNMFEEFQLLRHLSCVPKWVLLGLCHEAAVWSPLIGRCPSQASQPKRIIIYCLLSETTNAFLSFRLLFSSRFPVLPAQWPNARPVDKAARPAVNENNTSPTSPTSPGRRRHRVSRSCSNW